MKARTLTSFCHRAPRNPSHGDAVVEPEAVFPSIELMSLSDGSALSAAAGNAQQRARMPGDHQLFVGGNDKGRHAAGRSRDPWSVSGVGTVVQHDAEPRRRLAD